tara:strand:- start:334 stop:522 length:189 start_codon:yes stop_codon:yes gene_type:complete
MPFIVPVLTTTLKTMITAFFTQKVIEQTVLLLMKYLASKTTNQVDDKLVSLLEKSIAEKNKS